MQNDTGAANMVHLINDSNIDALLQKTAGQLELCRDRQQEKDCSREAKKKQEKEMKGWRKRGGGRDCSYPGEPVLSWGSAWLPLLCCSLSQRHDCIPLFTHYSSNTHSHTHAAASPCYSSSSPSISLPGSCTWTVSF